MTDDKKSGPKLVPSTAMNDEEGAVQYAKSVEPYIRLAMADMTEPEAKKQALMELSALPLEKRYLWRIVSALVWAFWDFDDVSVVADKEALSSHELEKVVELVNPRPLQFCMFSSALFGFQNMEKIMAGAVAGAKKVNVSPWVKYPGLQLEQRYLWRIVSALKWAFAGFDCVSFIADKATLSRQDLERVVDLLKWRPWQFCVFLSALLGPDKMDTIMTSTVATSMNVPERGIQFKP